ncbi:helix-turn-helix transcriptional regulator [Microbacterium sp. p3-SID338]|uniref:helix-turn-helix domain-containing protein n=1 Tax=unclassified Microbacterium TaxID=2609290 RepID=UPI001E4D4D90|nr:MULTISPECIES: helix-turn-helix transcriptional regulator [unclassified Microbacterium]MCT1394234.1 helix-turn-helix transcriptional regulator [Microbacterium sp. p3-SID338]
MMALTPDQLLERRPANRPRVDAHKERMLGEVRAYRLRELRERLGLSQAQLAERIGVGQRQVSKIENGDLDSARIGTVRKYIEAVGGDLVVEYVAGDSRLQVA